MLKSLSKLFYPTVGNRIGRVEYMKLTILYNFLFSLTWVVILGGIFFISHYYSDASNKVYVLNTFVLICLIILIINLFNFITLSIKRLHDFNFSGGWTALMFIPILGFIFIILAQFFIFPMIKSNKGENKYGTNNYVLKKTDYIYGVLYYLIYFPLIIACIVGAILNSI